MIINEDKLLEATGYKRAGDLELYLIRNGFPYNKARRIWTTSEALTHALESAKAEGNDIEFTGETALL